MIGRMFPPHQPAVRSPSDTVVRFVPTSVRESFSQKEPQSSVARYPAQPTCTVYAPSSAHCRISSQPGQSAFHLKPPTESYSARHLIAIGTPQGWTPAQVARSSKVNCRKNFQQKDPTCPQYKEANYQDKTTHPCQQVIKKDSKARHPAFFGKL